MSICTYNKRNLCAQRRGELALSSKLFLVETILILGYLSVPNPTVDRSGGFR